MRAPDREPFYVGYLALPPAVARRMRWVVAALVAGAALAAGILAVATGPFAQSAFEFGTERAFMGRIEAHPYPVLVARRVEGSSPFAGLERIPLVAPGKHGADELVLVLDGAQVRLRGMRVQRAGRTMVEIVPGSIERIEEKDGAPGASSVVELGPVTLTGEIVDSKCFLGVMNPGNLKVHRACANRCISGGIPPLLYARDARGLEAHVLLVSADGKPVNQEVLAFVARPVTISGRLQRRDDLFYLYADPARYELAR